MFFTLGGGGRQRERGAHRAPGVEERPRPRRHARPLVPRRELHGHGALGRCPHARTRSIPRPGACATCRRPTPIAVPSAARPPRNAAARAARRRRRCDRHGRRGPRRRGDDGSRTPAATASSPPDNFWPELRSVTRERDVYLIADEVMSGFGRCGEWFAWQRYGEANRPDLMTLAKGLTAASIPLGAVVMSAAVSREARARDVLRRPHVLRPPALLRRRRRGARRLPRRKTDRALAAPRRADVRGARSGSPRAIRSSATCAAATVSSPSSSSSPTARRAAPLAPWPGQSDATEGAARRRARGRRLLRLARQPADPRAAARHRRRPSSAEALGVLDRLLTRHFPASLERAS